jgi:hypothetical protein
MIRILVYRLINILLYWYNTTGWFPLKTHTVELHLSGLIGTTCQPDMQNIRIIGFFFENRLHWRSEVGGKILQTAVLGYIFIYVKTKH